MITKRSIVPSWVMAQIPTVWEIKGSDQDFHSEGAEILKVENHKREALL